MFARAKEVYQQTKKPIDNFWTAYISRPVAAVFVAWFEPTKITPNQVTLLSFFVGMLSIIWLAFMPGHWALIVGALAFQFAYVLDCVDGMLARARKTSSPQGHLLDFLMDELKAIAFLGAVSYRLYTETSQVYFLYGGLFGLVVLSSGLSLTTFTRRPEMAVKQGTGNREQGTAPEEEREKSAPPQEPSAPAPAEAPRGVSLNPIKLVESAAKFLIHYPSYFVYVAIADRADIYFYAYIAVNALYYARTLLSVALRAGRPS
jgi:phosphatidylglycerophosphate synthase